MFGMQELKERLIFTKTTVQCPVKNCKEEVERQRIAFKRENRFKCPKHDIYISTRSFAYQSELDNLLWKDPEDILLLNQIKTVKRESRMNRDTSEDAVTWNIFRFIEKNKLICDFLKKKFNVIEKDPDIIYWSYSQKQKRLYDKLKEAREIFDFRPSKGSEPDLIIAGKTALIFIEVKFSAPNKTEPKNPEVETKYVTGGDKWWDEVFDSNFKEVAVDDKKYELSRLWLIGTWMAKQLDLDFYLINLVLNEKENNIENDFKKHIIPTQKRIFLRETWEKIYDYISECNLSEDSEKNKSILIEYFHNKTMGYYQGHLKKAFSLPEEIS